MNISKTLLISTLLVGFLGTSSLYAKDSTAAKLTPAEMNSLATVAAIDKSEIMLGVVATHKKTNSGVMDYAKMMIDMHGSNLTEILEMRNHYHNLALTSPMANKLKSQSMKDMLALGALQGDNFDKAYVDAMVKGHQAALDLIDHQLLQTAKSDAIKKFLTDTRAVVVQHLDDAKKLQEKMQP